jgi:DDE family transposase
MDLALRSLCQNHAKAVIEAIKNKLFSLEFIEQHKKDKNDFIRNRKLNFTNLVLFILQRGKSSLQRELEKFFAFVERGKEITASVFTHARKKLCPEVFVSRNDVLVESFYHRSPSTSKTGIRRILAVDGSRLELPNNTEVVEAFGRANKQPDAKPLGIVSALFDVVNKVVLDSSINPADSSENHLAFNHLGKVRHGDLVILDRGYKCLWLMLGIVQKGAEYLIRLPVNAFKEVELFERSDEMEAIVTLHPTPKVIRQCLDLGIEAVSLRVRLVKVILDTGEKELLATSLMDRDLYPVTIFKELYTLRWGVEEEYKTMKSVLEVEQFSGKSPHAVRQEFYAAIFLSNLQSVIAREKDIQESIDKKSERRKYEYQENRTSALFL